MLQMNCFLEMINKQRKSTKTCFQAVPLLKVLTIANLLHITRRIWIFTLPGFWLCIMKLCCCDNSHWVKSVSIWSFSGPYFSALGLNTEIYFVNLRIQSVCGKTRTIKIQNRDTFYAVHYIKVQHWRSCHWLSSVSLYDHGDHIIGYLFFFFFF